ncbi:hypothetical protein EZ449_02850 [Pedobacter frigidisoli]|uniref:Uncharacterized protein n=1 Tax=Pedobacter frigidisoli TaxID=2530455 RepID=A0A4R0PCW1_9SPHI|nr:hypothetical protein [Pedobacter frigidisoli]TCD13003.1 hypothetical protein EZ449_02850 [Pedobacter frigidisoli]
MPEDYQDLVLAAYEKMRDNGKLDAILSKETTTKLRRACLKVYQSRFDPKDKDILAMFFGVDKMDCDFQKILNKSEPGDYRALWNHVRGETDTTDERNSNLLAWLIDLEPRPRSSYYLSPDKTITIGGRPIDDFFLPPTKVASTTSSLGGKTIMPQGTSFIPLFSSLRISIFCAILLFVGAFSFGIWESSSRTVKTPKDNEKFMYWNGDHYEPIKDDKQNIGTPIIPLNIQTLIQQRKISLPDTLTSYSIGKVWYKGYGNNHEYFTAAGVYPPDTARILKKLSSGILRDHISYYRYLFTRLVWFICTAFFISLCGFAVSKLEKKVDVKGDSRKQVVTDTSFEINAPPIMEQNKDSLSV